MVDRRTTLLGLLGACGAGLAQAAGPTVLAQTNAAPARLPSNPTQPESDGAAAMTEDLARLGSHEYSDEGIPVFLACVDWTAEKAGNATARASALSAHIAAELRRYGDAWVQMHPDAPDTDAGKVIEVLAERDFSHEPQGAIT